MTASTHFIATLVVCALLAASVSAQAYVGFSGALTMRGHNAGGTVTIVSATEFTVAGFTFDGLAPATYWYGAPSESQADILSGGARLNNVRVANSADGQSTITVTVTEGTLTDYSAIVLWCESATANLASLTFKTFNAVGFTGALSEIAHGTEGTVEIMSATQFIVRNFAADGDAPSTYFRGAASQRQADLAAGTRLSNIQINTVYDGSTDLTVDLINGLTLEDYSVISLWCETAGANFGSVTYVMPEYVGNLYALSEISHGTVGTIEIVSPVQFIVHDFESDGDAPSTYFRGAASQTQADLLDGTRISNQQINTVYDGSTDLTVTLIVGVTLDDFSVISLWCETAGANFGSTTYVPPAYAGFTGALTTRAHGVSGELEIVSPVEFIVRNFAADGEGPATFWRGAASLAQEDLEDGTRLSEVQVDAAFDGSTDLVVTLPTTTLDNFNVISLWCETADASFADVQFRAPPADNCVTLESGETNLAWSYDGVAERVSFTIEARLGENEWAGVGFSDAQATESTMIGSDVTIVGWLPSGEPFALDYKLTARTQCDYADTRETGVCPDTDIDTPANDVTIEFATLIDGVTRITFSRTVSSTDTADDNVVDASTSHPAVWARGPFEFTNGEPIILYHQTRRAGPDFAIQLDADVGNSCVAVLTDEDEDDSSDSSDGGASLPDNAPAMRGATTFNVTTGANPNYPNPPAWGLSYHVNGVETPVIYVQRGVEYTFNVQAGPTHPLYLTTSINGGSSEAETVFAGNGNSHGTPAEPHTFTWTPDADTPDLLYYQCFVHQKLGWRIRVEDATDTLSPVTLVAAGDVTSQAFAAALAADLGIEASDIVVLTRAVTGESTTFEFTLADTEANRELLRDLEARDFEAEPVADLTVTSVDLGLEECTGINKRAADLTCKADGAILAIIIIAVIIVLAVVVGVAVFLSRRASGSGAGTTKKNAVAPVGNAKPKTVDVEKANAGQ